VECVHIDHLLHNRVAKIKNRGRRHQIRMSSFSILFFVMITFSNINTILNFVYVFFVLEKLVPLLNTLHEFFCELDGKLAHFELIEISALILTFSSLANLCYVFLALFSSSISVSVLIRFLLYSFKSICHTLASRGTFAVRAPSSRC
jgi:hypothetical protein